MKLLKLTLMISLLQLILVLPLLYWAPSLAGIITRSTKPGSTTSFATSFSLGNTLQVADLDTDLNSVYSTINGNIESNNIADGTIVTADLADNAITTNKLVDANVTTGKLATGAVTQAKTSAGVAVNTSATGNCPTSLVTVSDTETTLVETSALTTRGGTVLLFGGCGLYASGVGATLYPVELKIYRGLSGVYTQIFIMAFANSDINGISIPVWFDTPAANTYTYKVTVKSHTQSLRMDAAFTAASGGVIPINAGKYAAVELS